MGDNHYRDIVLASSIEGRGDEAVTELYRSTFAGSEHGLDILVLQHLGQSIRAEQDQIIWQDGKRGDGGVYGRADAQGTG